MRVGMRRAVVALILLAGLGLGAGLWLGWQGRGHAPIAPLAQPADIVVLVTLDGVRPQEFLTGPDPSLAGNAGAGTAMPFLRTTLAPGGTLLGSATSRAFGLGNPMGISTPSYQSIFTGRLTACVRNECGAPFGRTLMTDIATATAGAAAVGFFSFSPQICTSARIAPRPGSVICGAGDTGEQPDADVLDAALAFLAEARPRFLYVALGAADSAAHGGDYRTYLDALSAHDAALERLHAEVARLRARGLRVTLLVTTDHGRGEGADWTGHRWNIAGSDRLWLLGEGHGVARQGVVAETERASLYGIRATVSHLLGLTPPRGPFFGPVLTDILDASPGQHEGQQ